MTSHARSGQPVDRSERTGGEPGNDPEQLRARVELTRRQLGDTIEELVAKADVKAQARRRGQQVRRRMHDAGDRAGRRASDAAHRPGRVAAGAVLAAAGVAGAVVVARHRRSAGRTCRA